MSKKVKFSKPSGPFYEPYTGKISEALDPIYDDQEIDIFEGGPAGQVLKDIDPFYGGIQLQEDELPGSQAMRDLARASKEITDVLTPSEETKAEIEERDRKEQEAFAMLLKATGVEPETFEASLLEGKLRRDNELRKLLNLPYGFDKSLTDFRLGFGTAGEFLFGEANKGLTTMTEEGTKFKDLPFDQKLGIAILPIDLLDVAGVTALGVRGLQPLLRRGLQKYGKKSGKTINDLLNDEELMRELDELEPGFMKELDNTLGGGIIQKRFMTGRKKGPVGTELRPQTQSDIRRKIQQEEAERLEIEGPMRFDDEGRPIFSRAPFSETQGTVDDALARAAREAEALKKETDKLKGFTGEQAADPVQVRAGESRIQGVGRGRGAKPTILTEDADVFLMDNPNLSDAAILEEFRNNPEKYLMKDTVSRGNIKDRRKSLGIKRTKGKFPKLEERKKSMFEDFQKKIAGGLDLENQEAVYNAFVDSYRKNYKETKAVKLLAEGKNDSARKKINVLINEFNDRNEGIEILNKQQINRLAPRTTTTDKRKTDISMFNKYLTGTDEYKKILNTLEKGDQIYFRRYLNFVRESALPKDRYPRFTVESEIVDGAEGNFDNFMKEYKPELDEMLDTNSSFYKDFAEFKRNDQIREEVGKLVQPLLDKMFPSRGKKSVQIGHKYRSSQIGSTLPEGLAGSGGSPMSYYLDLSVVNYELQDKLEKAAVKAIRANDKEKMIQISTQAADIGTEFVIDGMKFGKHRDARKQILDLIARAMNDKKFGVTQKELEDAFEAANIMLTQKPRLKNKGGLITEDMNIFDDEEKGTIFPKISIEFGDAALGRARRFGEEQPEDMVPLPLEEIQLGDSQPVKRASAVPQEKVFDVQPMENIFTGEVEQANLKLPFYKLFTKPPVNETAPIPTPKEKLDNPTKKQKESLEQEKLNKEQDFFDPTPEDNAKVDLGSSTDVAVTPKTNQALTGVFYSDVERALQRPDTPAIFPNKKALLDFLAKNRIKKTELDDYGINNLLQGFDDVTPIPKLRVIQQIRSAPVRGMHVHATGYKSELIDTSDRGAIPVAFDGYREDGFLPGTQSERVLFIPKDKLPGDTGGAPQTIFQGESIANHNFGIANESDAYIVGWTRLTERQAILPTKLAAPQKASKVPGLTRERERAQRQVAGLYAEAINKLNREGVRRGLNQADLDLINELSFEQMLTDYGDTLNELSPGLVDQIDELIVKVRDLDSEIAKGSTVDTSGVVRVQFADEIQSDIMQAAAARKQKLLATLRKIQEEGRESTTLPELDRIGNEALAFFEENKSVFRPLGKTDAEIETFRDSLSKIDAEIDDIINRFVETREISDVEIARVKSLLTDNIDSMIKDLIVVSDKTYEGLFPDLPFKKREEWADALIKKDLFELAYRKFVLKDPNTPDYYAVTPDQFVIDRYNFKGNSATPQDLRERDKQRQIDRFMARGEFVGSEYKGIGMSEFYGGPNALSNVKDADGKAKHYTSVIEKILKNQAKSNNSEFTVLNVQTKNGSQDVYRITDQNGNMVATLSNRGQADRLVENNPNYVIQTIRVPDEKSTTPSFAIKITEEMLEPYKTHKARGGLVEMIDIFEVA